MCELSNLHVKGFALRLALKQRLKAARTSLIYLGLCGEDFCYQAGYSSSGCTWTRARILQRPEGAQFELPSADQKCCCIFPLVQNWGLVYRHTIPRDQGWRRGESRSYQGSKKNSFLYGNRHKQGLAHNWSPCALIPTPQNSGVIFKDSQ